MRLNAFLARAGVASRRHSDELIKEGRVRVNGQPGELNTFVGKRDVVEVDGARVEMQPLAYVLLNKPPGVVTTADDPQGRPTVVDLVEHDVRVVPVGRLDADTTGALLLTNDGDLAHRLAHPRYGVPKVYDADIDGSPKPEALETLRLGVHLEDGRTRSGGRTDRPSRDACQPPRAHAPRGPQAPGEAHVRSRRAHRSALASQALCGTAAGRARAG